MTDKNKEKENLFKGRFDRKIQIEGTTDWFHDPSGEELEIICEGEEEHQKEK